MMAAKSTVPKQAVVVVVDVVGVVIMTRHSGEVRNLRE